MHTGEPPPDAYRLRARLRRLAQSQRERDCGIRAVSVNPGINVLKPPKGTPIAKYHGVLRCGRIWTCPVCSRGLRAERASNIDAALRGAGGRFQMLTVTLRHHAGMPLKELLAGLLQAWRRTRQGGAIQRIWREKVTASIRATEVTEGHHGWHPHIHALLRTEEWTPAERMMLVQRWRRIVRSVLGERCTPDDEHGLHWSEPFQAEDCAERGRYLSKLGLEMAGFGKRSLAERAADGDERSVRRWEEFSRGTRGRRMIEMDDRAVRFAKAYREKLQEEKWARMPVDSDGDLLTRAEDWPSVWIPLCSEQIAALAGAERAFPTVHVLILRDVQRLSSQGEEIFINWLRAAARTPSVHGRGSTTLPCATARAPPAAA